VIPRSTAARRRVINSCLSFGGLGPTHSHAAEADSRDLKAAFPKFALLHCFSFGTVPLISRLGTSAFEAVS
jgi:hypothetical protein